MGKPPLANDPSLLRIQLHLRGLCINTLNTISCWKENNSHWDGWMFSNLPPYLHKDRLKLASMLNGTTPLARREEDNFTWDPTGSPYSIKAGYEILLGEIYPSPSWAAWKQVWNSKALPKIKIFTWTLAKGKTLTVDNLNKKGIQGASRCSLCNVAEESIQHLFVACSFGQNC